MPLTVPVLTSVPHRCGHVSSLFWLCLGIASILTPVTVTAAETVASGPQTVAGASFALRLNHAFPTPGATHVCPDTPLRLAFAAPPTLGAGGKIQIVDAADRTVVDSIDVSSPTAVKDIGGLSGYKYYPVIVAGNEATIYPKNGALAYGKTYYVTVDAGVFLVGADPSPAVDQPAAWRFTTKAASPAASAAKLTVSADGTGDFCTVQGALDFIPDGNTTPITIFLRKGLYTEMVFFTNKHAITLLGEDRKECVLAYATNDRFNPSSGNPFGTANPNPSAETRVSGRIYHRGVLIAHHVNDFTLANLTIRNTTPHGGSQAEAIIFNGTTEARAIVKDVDLYSYQDTLQINGQAYLSGCSIEGDVDFMWGTGPCFFENCTARSVRSGAYYTQIRNPGTNHGFVYLHCTLDGAPDVTGNYLSRIEPHRFPHSEVVLLDCVLGPSVIPIGWQLQKVPAGAPRAGLDDLHFWEFNSHAADGQPADVSQRLAVSRRLKQPDDATTIADYRNPTFVLGHDWNPKAAPIFK